MDVGSLLVAGVLLAGGSSAPPTAVASVTGSPPVAVSFTAVHTRLLASEPAEGDTLRGAPHRFRLLFSGPVDGSLSSLILELPGGGTARLLPAHPGDTAEVLTAPAPALGTGGYVLRWRTVSSDGHRIGGDVAFYVAPPPADAREQAALQQAPARSESPLSSRAGSTRGDGEPGDGRAPGRADRPDAVAVLVAGLALALLLGFAGLLWFTGSAALLEEPAVRRTGLVLGGGACVALAVDLVVWMGNITPEGAGLAGIAAALANRTGFVGLLRLSLVLGAWFVLTSRRGGAAAVLAMLAAVLGAASGHSATLAPGVAVPVNALHLGAAAIWLGGLVLLVRCPGSPRDPQAAWTYRTVAATVSSAALLAVILVVGSGLVQTFLFVPGFGALLAEGYGRLVIGKAVGLGVLVLFGAWHRFRLLPALHADREASVDGLRGSVRIETIVMVLVLLVAAWLSQSEPPRMP